MKKKGLDRAYEISMKKKRLWERGFTRIRRICHGALMLPGRLTSLYVVRPLLAESLTKDFPLVLIRIQAQLRLFPHSLVY